jgi:NADH-quinone oxidoreductase subunit K
VDDPQALVALGIALFGVGLAGVVIRRNLLIMLMCMELMLNGVNLSLVTFAREAGPAGAVLVFLAFVVAAAEIAIAIPIVLLLVRRKRTLDPGAYRDLKG